MPVAIAWYKEIEWLRWLELSHDSMSPTHAAWLQNAEQMVKTLTKQKIEVHKVDIGIDEFCAWAKSQGYDFTGRARADFAGHKLSKHLMIPDIAKDQIPDSNQLKRITQQLKGKNATEIWEPYLRRPKAAICPVAREHNGKIEQFASGVLIQIGNAHFLLTAAHVADEFENHPLLIPYKNSFGPLAGAIGGTKLPDSGRREDDRYDVCYIRLEEDVANSLHEDLLFLDGSDCDLFDLTEDKDAYTLVGYPAKKSQTRNGDVSTSILCLSGDGVAGDRYERMQCQPDSHILIQHRRKKAVDYRSITRRQSPHPAGMSGGGVFAWDKRLPATSFLSQPKLVGILTEYHESLNTFVAVKLPLHLIAIQKNNPDLPIFVGYRGDKPCQ